MCYDGSVSCGSEMFIPDLIFTHPGSRIADPGSRIADPGSLISNPKTATKERGEKKFVLIPCFIATHSTKLKIILFMKG
jgi:hypothetical protein